MRGRTRRSREAAIEAFWKRVDVEPPFFGVISEASSLAEVRLAAFGPCWIFRGASDRGYGVLRFEGRAIRAHRFSVEVAFGRKVPPGLQLDHLCRVKACVNPAHLEAVTPGTNMRRMEIANYDFDRRTCRFGHEVPFALFRRAGCAKCRVFWSQRGRVEPESAGFLFSGGLRELVG